jgi:hypothetical protein
LFFPLMLLEVSLHVASVQALARRAEPLAAVSASAVRAAGGGVIAAAHFYLPTGTGVSQVSHVGLRR